MTTSPPDIAEKTRSVSNKTVRIDFAESSIPNSYDIVIGHGVIADTAALIHERLGTRRCIIVTDSNVDVLYRARLEAILLAGGQDVLGSIAIPAGEENKSFATLRALLDRMFELGADRKTLIIALGGGVVGDLAGFAASIFMRGIDVVQIPTTLLAQVDSSVGGKTGIDMPYGKNMVGSFYQPKLVLADVSLLDSLPVRELRAGYAEIVKYGLISDPEFFRWCASHGGQLLNGDADAQIQAIGHSCAAKAMIVAKDEKESGARALLNLGHTFGHALETATGFGEALVHGEAVAIGILMAFELSVRMGICPQRDYNEVLSHFVSVGLPTKPPAQKYDIPSLIESMAHDKKSEGGEITLVLAKGIGKAFIHKDADACDIQSVLTKFISHKGSSSNELCNLRR